MADPRSLPCPRCEGPMFLPMQIRRRTRGQCPRCEAAMVLTRRRTGTVLAESIAGFIATRIGPVPSMVQTLRRFDTLGLAVAVELSLLGTAFAVTRWYLTWAQRLELLGWTAAVAVLTGVVTIVAATLLSHRHDCKRHRWRRAHLVQGWASLPAASLSSAPAFAYRDRQT